MLKETEDFEVGDLIEGKVSGNLFVILSEDEKRFCLIKINNKGNKYQNYTKEVMHYLFSVKAR